MFWRIEVENKPGVFDVLKDQTDKFRKFRQ